MAGTHGAVAVLVLLIGAALPSRSTAQLYSLLERFVVDNGGVVRTKIGVNKDGVRGLYAREDIKKGEAILSVSGASILNVGSVTGSFLTPSLSILRELRHPASRFKPFLDSMPKPGEVVNACTLDRSLWGLLESDYWSRFAESWQAFLERAINGTANAEMEVTLPEALGASAKSLTLEELKYACALSATRYVASGTRSRLLMIPIYDMANHRRDCPHSMTGTDDALLVSVIAGADIKAGEEICYSYGGPSFRADYAATHYGFVYKEDPPRLLLVDHHQFNPSLHHQHITEDQFVATSAEQVNAELVRLKNVQATLQQLDKDAAKSKSRPRKGASPVSDMLLDLQAYRRQAVDFEIKRLLKVKF